MTHRRVDYVAEIGLNHGGNLDEARRLVDAAADSGATSVKFQTYLPEERVPPGHPLWELLVECTLTPDETHEVLKHAQQRGLRAFSTAFGLRSLQLLIELNVERVKVASFCVAHEELITAASNFAPIVVATGTSTMTELMRLRDLLRASPYAHTILHCVSAYPTRLEDANLSNISLLRQWTSFAIGFSDHTQGWVAASGAVLLGSEMVEKHFTLSNHAIGPDHAMSADPETFRQMVSECESVLAMLGSPRGESPYECEVAILPFRTVTTVKK